MTDKKKIVLIYVGVAVFSALILGMSYFLTTLKKEQREQSPAATDIGKLIVDEMAILEADIELERQDGSKVMISDLKDKVWVAAQFYAKCPMCAERNADSLLTIYREFKDEEDFMVVCLSVDPENDTPKLLAEVRDALEVSSEDWWFLKAEREKLWSYMTDEMYFTRIEERMDPTHIQQKGRWAHDMGLQLYRGDVLVHKWDKGIPLDQLRDEIKEALRELKKPDEQSVTSVE